MSKVTDNDENLSKSKKKESNKSPKSSHHHQHRHHKKNEQDSITEDSAQQNPRDNVESERNLETDSGLQGDKIKIYGAKNNINNNNTDPIEEQPYEEEEELLDANEDPDKELKKNLMFGIKNIKISQLYCHLSGSFEVFLMIVGFIGSLGSGIAAPFMAYLFGGSINDFSTNTNTETDYAATMTPEDMLKLMNKFQKTIDDMVNKYLYFGTGLFVAEFLNNFNWHLASLRMIYHLKEKYFAIILTQEQGWFDSNNAFEFSTKVGAQLEQIEMGLGEKLADIIKMIAQLIAGLAVALSTSWKLTLVMICIAPLMFICIIYLVTSMKKAIILSRKTYEIAGGVAEELLYNIKTVASFANFDFENERYGKYIDKVFEFGVEIAKKMSISLFGIMFFLNSSFCIAFLYAKKLILDEDINSNTGEPFNGGDVMTVIFSTIMSIMSIGSIAPNIKTIQESTTASSDYFTLYERKPQIDLSGTLKPGREKIKGQIEFKDIKFIYPSDEKKKVILDGLNLVFETGKKVALVGESGCGKSTTVNLIERLYEPVSGHVLIDGIDIKEYDLNYLRTFIGYVQQEPVLFNTSIRENIIFGREELLNEYGNVDDLINKACEDSFAKEFIDKFPEKLEYKVGIKGSKLSGGQKQRLAIARAILCNPKILILDEATSALDNKSEKEVQKALDNISKKNVTTVIIAHRLSTIKNADLIYAIKEGKVLEQGTHKELLAKNGYYAGLVKSQLAQDELESKEENSNLLVRKRSSMRNLSRKMSRKLSMKFGEKVEEVVNPQIQIERLEKISGKSEGVRRGKLFELLKDNKCDIFLGSLASIISGGLMPAQGLLLSKAINCLTGSKQGIRDKGLFWSMMFLALAAANGITIYLKIRHFIIIAAVIVCKMRKIILGKYLELHMSYYDLDTNAPGALLTKLSLDTTQLNSLVFSIIGDVVSCIGVIAVGLTMGLYYSWRLTLINLCFLPFIVISRIFIAKSKHGGRQDDKKINIEAGSVLSECVINTKTIYSFNFQTSAVEMYLNILEESKRVFFRDSIVKGILSGLGTFATYASMACIFHYAFEFIKKGKMDYNQMNESMNIVMMLTNGIGNNIMGLTEYSKAQKAFNSIYSTMDTESLIDITEEFNKNKKSAKNLKGKIEFKNVSFAYPTKPDQKVLKEISFVINPGQSAALVGYSGCGKSTTIQLLERFYDVDEGEILIDDINIKDYNLLELRKKIGLVSQEPVLFKRSVFENIRYGKLTADKNEVFTAAKAACIEKFFNKKEMGTKEDPVSGGEKQRLAIARAFLKDPTILLLDEATSALDKESEKMVQESIYKLQKNRTSISIAHRLSTIEDSDIIFVLESGRIVEQGNHQELLAKGGKYATLYKFSDTS